jgi:hypothetical protein
MPSRRATPVPVEQPTRLQRSRSEARQRIVAQIAKGREILNRPISNEADVEQLSTEYQKWNDFNGELLRLLFLSNRIVEDYDRHRLVSFQMGGGIRETLRVYLEYIKRAIGELESVDQRLELIPEALTSGPATVSPGLSELVRLLGSFHRVARQLRFRREGRATLKISDEYDVQDLLHALLKIDFSDVRPEEWTPSYAGKSSRTDFLLKNEKIVVETKKTRSLSAAKNIGDELIIDIARYQTHPDCKLLVCFVYDPDGYIQNPAGLKNDLQSKSGSFEVHIVVEPHSAPV